MRYNEVFVIIFLLSILLALFILSLALILKSYLNIILTCDVSNNDINIKLNVKYLFDLININVPIYPTKKNKNKKEPTKKNKKVIKIKDLKKIYKLVKKIKIQEIYSDINFGNENINFTCFIYVFINCIYGNLINAINPEKMYLNANPNFTKNYINASIKLHLKPTIKDITSVAIAVFKIYKKTKMKKKDGGNSEINRVNTKSYGDNI